MTAVHTMRVATPADAAGMLDIYAPYIERTTCSFESEVPSVAAFAERIRRTLETWPWLVCEADGQVAGYAYASRYRERPAYQWCAESSIYVHPDHRGQGIGRALYPRLLTTLTQLGYRTAYAAISLPNAASVSLHERCGFEHFATFEKVGWKLGQWVDVGWWRVVLNEFSQTPRPPARFSERTPDLLARDA